MNTEDWIVIPIVCYPSYAFLLILADKASAFYASFIITSIGLGLVWLSYEKRKPPQPDIPTKVPTIPTDSPILILGAIYGIVAAFAITQALTILGQALDLDSTKSIIEALYQRNNDVMLLLSFIFVSIPFYHGAAVFLSTRAAELLNEKKEKQIFFYFIMLFSEAAFLYLLGSSVRSIETFTLWLIILIIVDLAWVLVARLAMNEKAIPPEWIHLDLLIIGFSVIFLLLPSMTGWNNYVILSVILLARTIVDYKVAWHPIYFRIRRK